jgi:DNA-binding transcriptional MerR regulator
MNEMTVSELARCTDTTADTIRYYERIGLLPPAERSPAGYHLFGDDDMERVAFVKRAQRFGLQLDEIGELLGIRDRGLCPCGHAERVLSVKLDEIREQLRSLTHLRDDIQRLLDDGVRSDGDGCWPCGSQLIQIDREPRRTT